MIKVPRFSNDEIETSAQEFRTQYWKDQKEPIDIDRIVEIDLRMYIVPVKNLLNDLEIDAFISKDLRTITIDYDIYDLPRNENRRRFSLSHEIGHIILHSEIYRQLDFASPDEWKDFIDSISPFDYQTFEYQAYEFAGRLLLPRKELLGAINFEKAIIEQENLLKRVQDHEQVLSFVKSKIANSFKVSSKVVEKRISSDNLDLASLLGMK